MLPCISRANAMARFMLMSNRHAKGHIGPLVGPLRALGYTYVLA